MCEFFNLCKTQIPFKEKKNPYCPLSVHPQIPGYHKFETQVFHCRLEKKLSWVKIKEESLEKRLKRTRKSDMSIRGDQRVMKSNLNSEDPRKVDLCFDSCSGFWKVCVIDVSSPWVHGAEATEIDSGKTQIPKLANKDFNTPTTNKFKNLKV